MSDPGQTEEREIGPPPEEGTPFSHPADHSWNLQMLVQLQGSVSKLEERTSNLGNKIDRLHNDLGGFLGRGEFWGGITLVIGALVALAGIFFSQREPPVVMSLFHRPKNLPLPLLLTRSPSQPTSEPLNRRVLFQEQDPTTPPAVGARQPPVGRSRLPDGVSLGSLCTNETHPAQPENSVSL